VAQVEYGPTWDYGAFTLLKVFTSPAQEMVLTGLRPATEYHFRVKSWDAAGVLGASNDFTFSTAPLGPATLLGEQNVQFQSVSIAGGQAVAYQFTAQQSGQASGVRLFLDGGTSAAVVRVGLYADREGAPAAILSQGSTPGLTVGWSTVPVTPVSLVKDARYWIVVLSPLGRVNLRDAGVGGTQLLSAQTTLAALPAAFVTGSTSPRGLLSAYVQQVPPAVTLMAPADNAMVTGSVELSAIVDDDAPLARVQFLVDGLPVGPPLTEPPYSITWDTTRVSTTQPHLISARASDLLGRSATSASVTVQVNNGPDISKVVVSRGLTASSARVTWSTDVLADSQVEFGPTTAYGFSTPLDSRLTWQHDAQLTGLSPGMTYHYRVRSRDANGVVAVSADSILFTPEP
jgi:hypothetical protein